MADYLELAAQLRKQRADEEAQRRNMSMGGAATSSGGTVGGPMFQGQNYGVAQQQAPENSLASSLMNGAKTYNNASNGGLNRMFGLGGTGGATGSAISSAMPAMSAGGGSSLGSMGLMSSAAPVSFPGAATGGAAAGGGGAAAAGGAGSGLMGAAMSNPWTAIAAAIIGGANYMDNKGISSWEDSLKGQAGGKMLDYYGGRKDGKTHGFIGKLFDKDNVTGSMSKTATDFNELDFSNALKNGGKTLKNIFKLKFF